MSDIHEVIEVEIASGGPGTSLQKEDDVLSNPCKLCLEEIPPGNKFTMESCGCFFCVTCMKTYVEVLVKDGVVLSITCPDSECVIQGSLQIHEVSTLVDGDTFEKYLRMKYEQEVAVDPHRTFCPNPNCSSVCSIYNSYELISDKHQRKKRKKEAETSESFPSKVSCLVCHFEFCNICKTEWAEGHKCNDLNSTVGNEFMKLKNKAGLSLKGQTDAVIKRCPVCSVLIEKDRGCAQMICKHCSHVFCWYCLKLLDNDFMLRHYDKGPCKNFLGHSRSQVLRHRLGVIGLFTAFSLLLIVAAPILILAAPVFLCCKWKDCCERAWRRAQQENNNALFAEFDMELKGIQENSLEVISEVVSTDERNSENPALPQSKETIAEVKVDESSFNAGNVELKSTEPDQDKNDSHSTRSSDNENTTEQDAL